MPEKAKAKRKSNGEDKASSGAATAKRDNAERRDALTDTVMYFLKLRAGFQRF